MLNFDPSPLGVTDSNSLWGFFFFFLFTFFLASTTSVYRTSVPHKLSSALFHVLLQDCDRPGRACMTISCRLGPQLKEEALSIDIKLLLNTEILKTVESFHQS